MSTTAREHYEQVLTEARAIVAPVVMPLDLADIAAIDALEVCNTEIGDRYECFELGPFTGGRWLRIRSTDNIVLADVLRRLADDISSSTDEERDAKARSEMVECPGCRTRISPDDISCGAVRCYRIAAEEAQL